MREHQPPPSLPTTLCRRPCELFVPRVKESRLCSVCGFTLIDHNVEPVPYQTLLRPEREFVAGGSLRLPSSRSVGSIFQHPSFVEANEGREYAEPEAFEALSVPRSLGPSYAPSPVYMTKSIESALTPSLNSAFSEYKRTPSKDSIAISDISAASSLSYKMSPYSQLEPVYEGRHHHRRSASQSKMEQPPKILKPKPLPVPRPYLRQQLSLAPTVEDDQEDLLDEGEFERSPSMFRRIKQKRRDRSASSHGDRMDRSSLSPAPESQNRHSVSTQETVVRPPNFKELLNRFQSAAEDSTPSPQIFQRHHSVRLPSTTHQNRRFTLGGDALRIDTKLANTLASQPSPMAQLQPPPVVRLRTATTPSSVELMEVQRSEGDSDSDSGHPHRNGPFAVVQVALREQRQQQQQPTPPRRHVERRESEAYQAALRARRAGLVGSLIESMCGHSDADVDDDDEDRPRSSPDEDANGRRRSTVLTPTVTVTTHQPSQPPPVKKRQNRSELADTENRKPKPANRSHSTNANGTHRKRSTQQSVHTATPLLRTLPDTFDENSNEKLYDKVACVGGGVPHSTPDYLSGGSDSGCPRGPWSQANSAETSSSLESPRSPNLLRSPNPVRAKAAEDLYNQMTVQHTGTLAFLIDNFADICKQHGEFSDLGKDFFEDLSVETLIFKSNAPLLVKDKLALFDGVYVAPNYVEYKVTIMLAPTCQYAPLMGRNAERSGFGPTVLAEIEETEQAVRHLLDQTGIEPAQRSSVYRLVVMPPVSLCSFHSLAAHNMHRAMNVQRYEHHVCFIMLQLLCALKVLQSDGVEHLSNNFKEFLLTYKASDLKASLEELHQLPKLLLLRETMEEEYDDVVPVLNGEALRVGICRYALRALCTLLNHKMHNTVPNILERTEFSRPLRRCAELLHMDKSSSLTEAKNLLEFAFFCGRTSFESELDAKLWLDERRSHEVNRAVRLLADRTGSLTEARERMYVQFLLSATPRTLFHTYRQLNKC